MMDSSNSWVMCSTPPYSNVSWHPEAVEKQQQAVVRFDRFCEYCGTKVELFGPECHACSAPLHYEVAKQEAQGSSSCMPAFIAGGILGWLLGA